MATIHVKDDTYQRLSQQAAARNTTIEDFVEPVLDQLARAELARSRPTDAPAHLARSEAFEEWMSAVQSRANRYPAGFVADDERDKIYDGRGE